MPINSGNFRKGQSGNPAGKPKGAKDLVPRSSKAAVVQLLSKFGNNVALIEAVIQQGLESKAPSSFPYLKLIIEQTAGLPEQELTVQTKVVHIHERPR